MAQHLHVTLITVKGFATIEVLGQKVVMLAATRVLSHLSTQPRRGLITKVSHRV